MILEHKPKHAVINLHTSIGTCFPYQSQNDSLIISLCHRLDWKKSYSHRILLHGVDLYVIPILWETAEILVTMSEYFENPKQQLSYKC